MNPLFFRPLIKRALWGGRRLETDLGKLTGGVCDAAESWEVCDLPGNETLVEGGPWHGHSLRQLMQTDAPGLLGRHAGCPQFPLLVKFLDAQRQLSVQVHPHQPTRMADGSLRLGKAESWIVLAASPESRMYLGLKPGTTEQELRDAIAAGRTEERLHAYSPQAGDCIFLEPGTVHALGGGLLIAEIQQPSDITYRLHDWGRLGAEGRPRELHVEAGLAATKFSLGPVRPQVPVRLPGGASEELVSTRFFVIQRHSGPADVEIPDDERMHVLTALSGELKLDGGGSTVLTKGQTIVLPAARPRAALHLVADTVVLDAFLPDDFALV